MYVQAYILLIQLHPDIPRIHHVKGLRKSLNSDIQILDLPAPYVGKYMDVKKTITNTWQSCKYTYTAHVHKTAMRTILAGEARRCTTDQYQSKTLW